MSYGHCTRVSARQLPNWPSTCDLPKDCPYRKARTCDEPRTNKCNGDAACHQLPNKTIIQFLEDTTK